MLNIGAASTICILLLKPRQSLRSVASEALRRQLHESHAVQLSNIAEDAVWIEMDPHPTQAVCQRLERSWFDQDYAACGEILLQARASLQALKADEHGFTALVSTLLPMTIDKTIDDLDVPAAARFLALRADVLNQASALDIDLMIGLKADDVAAQESASAWAASLYDFILHKSQTIGMRRRHLWENAALIHWGVGRLLSTCCLSEGMLAKLLHALMRTHAHLNWEATGSTILKAVMQDERTKLHDVFVAQLEELARQGHIEQPENFIQFDSDGRLLPTLVTEMLKVGVGQPNGVALLYFLVQRGNVSQADFLARVAGKACFIQTERRLLIVAGEGGPTGICRTVDQHDSVGRPIDLTWWLNVNFPREQLGNPAFIASRIPLFVRVLISQNKASLCLDASAEGSRFSPRWEVWMRGLTTALQCRPNQIVYLPQNTSFAENYAALCGVAPSERFRVAPFNSHLLTETLRSDPEVARPTKRFLCLNQRSHLHRAALMLSLRRDGIADETHLSFNQPIRAEYPLRGDLLQPWMQTPAAVIDALIEEAENVLPLRLDLSGKAGCSTSDGNYIESFNRSLFADSAVYLVTETEMEGSSMCRFTEKTVKGLAAEIPFIIFGGAGTLAALRDLGFRTFSPLIDESYDTMEDPIARFHQAYAEVRRLAALPMEALVHLRQILKPVLDHNRQRLLTIETVLHDHLANAIDGSAEREPWEAEIPMAAA